MPPSVADVAVLPPGSRPPDPPDRGKLVILDEPYVAPHPSNQTLQLQASSAHTTSSHPSPEDTAPPPSKPSYAAIAQKGANGYKQQGISKSKTSPSFAEQLAGQSAANETVGIKEPSTFRGKPAILFTDDELDELTKPLEMTLIGKFPIGRPKMEAIHRFFADLKLHGSYQVVNLDIKHFVVHFQNFDDYTRMFAKPAHFINGFQLKFLKWSLDFNVLSEPPVHPVWVSLPMSGMHIHKKNTLFSIGKIFGKPLKMDSFTTNGTKPDTARILVEMNILEHHPHEIWLGSETRGYWL